jgi:hypothetical protein
MFFAILAPTIALWVLSRCRRCRFFEITHAHLGALRCSNCSALRMTSDAIPRTHQTHELLTMCATPYAGGASAPTVIGISGSISAAHAELVAKESELSPQSPM